MAEETGDELFAVNAGQTGNISIEWTQTPTHLIDSVIGFVTVGGVPRITLGQVTYRTGGEPVYVPILTLACPAEALKHIAAQLTEIAGQSDLDGEGDADEQIAEA